MNERDNFEFNDNAPDSAVPENQTNNEESVNKSENTVSFNEDGTYHASFSRQNTPNEENNSARVPPQTNGYYSGSANQYPYGNNNSYPYGNGSYPYGGGNQNYGSNNNYQPGGYERGYAYDNNSSQGNNGKKSSKGAKIFAIVAGALCVFLVVVLIAVVMGGEPNTVTPGNSDITESNPSENVDELETNASPVTDGRVNADGELSPKAIFKKVLPTSVGIMVYDNSKTLASEGSGVLFQESKDGKYTYIITCAHVISEATGKIRVQLSDGSEYDADIVGYDTRTDIGVIRIEKSGLQLAEIGDSTKTEVGDFVYAIGNPGGVEFANSFTDGIVSALDRPVNSSSTGYTTECIQHTAAINPGNSGGALVNSFGQVIGINSMKIVADEYEGMGFSVPSSVFVKIVNEIMEHGYVTNRPKLGITYVPASEYSTYGMFVAIKGLPSGTIVVYDIAEDSSLAGTKVEKGDMIVAANGVELDDASYLSKLIEGMNVGDELTLSIVRLYDDYSFEEFDVTVTLVEDRGNTVVSQEEPTTSGSGGYSGGYGDYGDIFGKYFEEYFEEYYGGAR